MVVYLRSRHRQDDAAPNTNNLSRSGQYRIEAKCPSPAVVNEQSNFHKGVLMGELLDGTATQTCLLAMIPNRY